jgi:hypothetical protein
LLDERDEGWRIDGWSAWYPESPRIADPIRSSPEEKQFIYRFDGVTPFETLRVVETRWDGEHYRSILPEPWFGISDGRYTGSELLVRKHPLDGSLRTSIAVLDPDFSTLAALMMTSAMPKAAVFVEENADRIFAHGSLAGAAAAYAALSSGHVGDQLLRHIREFEESWWYPDCAVIAAWRMIRFPEARRDVRRSILEAFWSGPPFFSTGVGLILDALTMLGPDDADAVACADVVKRVAIRLDTTQVFTTVRARSADRNLALGR